MKMSKVTSIFAGYSVVIGLVLVSIIYLGVPGYLLRNAVSLNCISTFSTPRLPNKNAMIGTLLIRLDKNNKGSFSVSGILHHESDQNPEIHEKWTVLRNINFDYHLKGDGFIEITNLNVDHSAADKVSDKYFNHNVFDLGLSSRTLRITKIKDAWLFSTPFSPVVMCVNKA
jgi:hypothetical protein